MIIIEGPDNAGKSTLARHLSETTGWSIQPSEGPAKSVVEINTRIRRYFDLKQTIFDRFPLISNPIYDAATARPSHRIDPWLADRLYDDYKPLMIYCDPLDRGMSGHVFNAGVDTDEHVAQVKAGYDTMLTLYRTWAIERAHLIYRIRDDLRLITAAVTHFTNGRSL